MRQVIAGTANQKAPTEMAIKVIRADSTEESSIIIRDIESVSELRSVEALQKEVWGCADLDVVPLTILVAGREVGATLIGAYDGASLVGFVYGFPGYEQGSAVHHSHMLAVKPAYRNHKLGFKLKLAQRERVLAQGTNRITWTFDPLQSLNAHLNFAKLGVIADAYKINFYGEATSSFLHQIGTDRLWVTWLIDSQPVRERLHAAMNNGQPVSSRKNALALVRVMDGQIPRRNEAREALGNEHLSIEIPWDINALQSQQPRLALDWREATRWAFTNALSSNYVVEDFYRANTGNHSSGVYLLTLRK
jgi:predicted GNAT superfamily acetyltransferase